MSSYDTIMLKHRAKIALTLLRTAAVHLGVCLSLSLSLSLSVCLSVSLCGMQEWLLMYMATTVCWTGSFCMSIVACRNGSISLQVSSVVNECGKFDRFGYSTMKAWLVMYCL